jgi:glycosyltransferase involved in cell wall biosynthesis
MRRILLITNFKQGTGISVQVQLLGEKLKKEGYTTEIFSTKGSILYRSFILFKLLNKGRNFDIFHVHGCSAFGFFPIVVGVICGKISRKKIILTYHGGGAEEFFKKYSSLVKFFLCKTDQNIVLSGFLGKIFDKYAIPYTVIPNMIEFGADVFGRREQINPYYISVRSLYKLYNVDCILRAFQLVQQNYPQATLTILGDGPEKAELMLLSEKLSLKSVVFVGKIDNSKIYEYLSKADIFVSASTVDNQPVSILEAFDAGLPVIAGNVGGIPYMVENDKTGYLFSVENYRELAERMIVAVENQKLSQQMIMNAKSEVEKYRWGNVKIKLLNLYH